MNKTTRLAVILGCIGTLGALTVPPAADAQPASKIPRIGILANASPSVGAPLVEVFRQGMRELGY